MTGTAWYCYAVARPFDSAGLAELSGVSGAEVAVVEHGDLVAVVSPVPADAFTETELHAKLEDLDWLERVARAHNSVVDWTTRQASTVPFRLATIFLGRQAVTAVLREREQELSAALDRIAGRVELGVKVYAAAPVSASLHDDPDRARPGSSYLRRKRSERDSREAGWRAAAERGAEIDRELSRRAVARRQHGVQNSELSGADGQNVLNVAYLVAEDAVDEFAALARKLGQRTSECRVELTGPWAPYSFALGAPGTGP